MTTPYALGIDLGTTHTVVSLMGSGGHTEMFRNRLGELFTPSAVFVEDSAVLVGMPALQAGATQPDRLATYAKRDLGSESYSRAIGGEYLPPEVIQACILDRVRREVAEPHGPNMAAVIAVPAYFGEHRRQATADAAMMAGLRLLDLLNEPTAAVLASYEHSGYLTATDRQLGRRNILVYDLGGHTFEVTLLEILPGVIRMVTTEGDNRLGGHDWDTRLLDYVAQRFIERYREDPRQHALARERLLRGVQAAKHALTLRTSTTIRLEHAGERLEIKVHREEFERLAADLWERTALLTEKVLRTANAAPPQIARVLLVGGATRMPLVSARLEKMLGRKPDASANPEEAVARGAAIFANHLLASQRQPAAPAAFKLASVSTHSLGIEGTDPASGENRNLILLPKHTPLPAKVTRSFPLVRGNPPEILVQVLEGESSEPSECTLIGRAIIRDLPADLKVGWPVEVTYEFSDTGRLQVSARVPFTGREVHLELTRAAGLSSHRREQWREAIAAGGGLTAFRQVLRRERSGEHAPPVALAVSTATGKSTAAHDTSASENASASTTSSVSDEGASLVERYTKLAYIVIAALLTVIVGGLLLAWSSR